MTRKEAMLQAVLDSPTDDNVRGIYADLLDEDEITPEGEFIRVQLELERRIVAGETNQSELRSREIRLFDPLNRYFSLASQGVLGPISRGRRLRKKTPRHRVYEHAPPVYCVQWRRGFVDEVWLPDDVWHGKSCAWCNRTGIVDERHECPECEGRLLVGGCIRKLFAAQPVQIVHLVSDYSTHRIEIEQPGPGYGWQVYHYPDESDDYARMDGGMDTRQEMIDYLLNLYCPKV